MVQNKEITIMATQMIDDHIDTKHLPGLSALDAIPGLTFRKFRGESDYPHMVAVISGSKDADQIERVDSVEDVARVYASLTNCDPYQDMIFAEVDGEVVGYARCTWWNEQAGTWVYSHFGFLLPEWRGKSIGRAMLRYLQHRLRQIARDHLESGKRPGDAPLVYRSFASDTESGTIALLESEGFRPIRYFYSMVRPDLEGIPSLPLPHGVEVRPVDWEAQKRLIFDAEQEAFRDHWGYSEPDEDGYRAWVNELETDPDIDPALWRVAWSGDQIVGMVRSFILPDENAFYQRQRGYTEHISVRKPWRKQSVARALIALSLQALKDRGMQEAALGVDSENTSGALRLYEGMGFRQVKKHINYEKPMD
jgi:mycothiol synthase